jgi:hypothetical protein
MFGPPLVMEQGPNTIGAGDIGAPIVLADCKEDGRVFIPITY